MKARHLLLILVAVLATGLATANPAMSYPPGLNPMRVEQPSVPVVLQRLLVGLLCVPPVALYLESLMVAFLVGRKRLFADAFKWLLISSCTYVLLIVIPFRCLGVRVEATADAFNWQVLLLESVIVTFEAYLLWLLWFREERSHRRQPISIWPGLRASFAVSSAGNAVSFLISVSCLYMLSGWSDAAVSASVGSRQYLPVAALPAFFPDPYSVEDRRSPSRHHLEFGVEINTVSGETPHNLSVPAISPWAWFLSETQALAKLDGSTRRALEAALAQTPREKYETQ